MASNNFKIFNEDYANVLSDSDYSSNSQRAGGLTDGTAQTSLHNKAFRQFSMWGYAMGELLKAKGYVVSDAGITAFQTVVNNIAALNSDGALHYDLIGEVTGNLIGNADTATNGVPLGSAIEFYGATLPTRHLWVNGLTIGDASSGSTSRANADTIDLYTVLWNSANVTGSQMQLYTSAGVLTSKGISAAADFAAHKRLSLPDKRGRAAIGLDNMGGTSANVVTNVKADIMSGFDGEENHTLTISESVAHSHIVQHSSSEGSGLGAIGGELPDYNGSIITNSIGGSGSHNNMQPWVACNFIMRY